MKRRFFVHFDISSTCMQVGVRTPEQEGRDVFDVLADKMRMNPDVMQMIAQIGPSENEIDKVVIGVGREYDE